jgi:hypothetical protein
VVRPAARAIGQGLGTNDRDRGRDPYG